MPSYILLIRNNSMGAGWMLDGGVEGAAARARTIELYGGRLIHEYPVMGRFDAVAVVEFEDAVGCLAYGQASASWGQFVEALPSFERDDLGRAREVAQAANAQIRARFEEVEASRSRGET